MATLRSYRKAADDCLEQTVALVGVGKLEAGL